MYSTNIFSNNENKYIINKRTFDFQISSNREDRKKEFVVGAFLPFTGSLSSMGKSVKIALEKAKYDVNKHFQNSNSTLHFNLLMADSKTSPEDSLVEKKNYNKMVQTLL